MMVCMFLIGQVCTSKGLVQQRDLAGNAYPWTLPANSYERAQRRVPVLVNHDEGWRIGEVQHWERSRAGGLMLVAELNSLGPMDDDSDESWYLSPDVISTPYGPLERGHGRIEEVSVVPRTASLGTLPVRWSPHTGAPHNMPLHWYDTWSRAHEARSSYRYRRDDKLSIVDIDPLDLIDEVLCDPVVAERVAAEAAAIKTKARAAAPSTTERRYVHRLGGRVTSFDPSPAA
jgi:hypothetical protein